MNSNYSVLLPVFNEPQRIIPAIENFKNIAEIIVLLDEFDTKTEEYLKKNNIKYIRRPNGFNQWKLIDRERWMLNQVTNEYVLFSNASMLYPKSLIQIFEQVSSQKIYDGVKNAMFYWSHGKLVQRPFLFKKSSSCYFFRKSSVCSNLSEIHNEFKLSAESLTLVLKPIKELSIHVYRDDDMPIVTQKHVSYAVREALEKADKQVRINFFTLVYKPLKSFLIGYFQMGGFLSGIEGLIYHINYSIYLFLVYSRLWEIQNKKIFDLNRSFHLQKRMQIIKKNE